MRPPLYIHALKDDLDNWISDGLVPEKSRSAILESVTGRKGGLTAVGVLAILGAIFMALAGLSFVAANWGAIAKIWRFVFILALMWSAFGVCIYALKRKAMAFAHAFALLGAALFGAGVMLVAQIFNISAHYPNGILIWAVGAMAVAYALQSRPVLLMASALTSLWMLVSYWGPLPGNPAMLAYGPMLLALWGLARKTRATESVHVLVLATLVLGINLLAQYYPNDHAAPLAGALFAVLTLGILLWAGIGRENGVFGAKAVQLWCGLALGISTFFLQFSFSENIENVTGVPGLPWIVLTAIGLVLVLGAMVSKTRSTAQNMILKFVPVLAVLGLLLTPWLDDLVGGNFAHILYGAFYFAGAVYALLQGVKLGHKGLLWMGGVAFAAEALYAYFETFKTLLNTSLFFFLGGALLLAMALFAMRFSKRLGQGEGAS